MLNLIRAMTEGGCAVCNGMHSATDAAQPAKAKSTILASVGVGGKNLRDDVLTVQILLNGIPVTEGRPDPLIAEDGWAGAETSRAIVAFQKRQFGWHDGKVEPQGQTFQRLKQLQHSVLGWINDSILALRIELMLAKANSIIPDLLMALNAALRNTESAIDRMTHESIGTKAFVIADQHFAFNHDNWHGTRDALLFIRTTIQRMCSMFNGHTSVFGGEIFGPSIFDVDWSDPSQVAHVPVPTPGDRNPKPHRIYLGPRMERFSLEHYRYISLHELSHLVSTETPLLAIQDFGYTTRGEVFKIPHWQRIRNADNFATYIFRVGYGLERLEAAHPKIKGQLAAP